MDYETITVIDNINGTSEKMPPSKLAYGPELAELVKSHGKNVFSFTHMNDFDGIGSAALLMHYFEMPQGNAAFSGYDKESFEAAAKEIRALSPKNGVVIFCDMGVDDHMVQTVVGFLDSLKAAGNLLLWFDHHPWGERVLENVAKHLDYIVAGENLLFCGSEILYLLLCKKDEFGPAITKKIHLSDFKPVDSSEYKATEKMRFAIDYVLWTSKNRQKKLRSLAKLVSDGETDGGPIKKLHDAGERLSRVNLQKMLYSSVLVEARYKIAVGFGKDIDTNSACRELMKKHGADIGLFIRKGAASGHLRSDDDAVDCSILARAFGGNGHPQAAGFQLDKAVFGAMGAKERREIIGLVKEKAVWTYQK